jgi:membrane-associated phospholipid phosphatase
MHSFPAGHFANALSCATYWNKRFRMGAAEPLIYAIAGAVGIGRLADGAHWTSDSVLGGVLGYAVGSEIARRSLARQVQRVGGAALNVSPSPDGLTMQMRWQF